MSNKCENMFYDVAQFLEQNNCCKELKKKKRGEKTMPFQINPLHRVWG